MSILIAFFLLQSDMKISPDIRSRVLAYYEYLVNKLVLRLDLKPLGVQEVSKCKELEVIYQTLETVFVRDIQTPRRVAKRGIFDEIRSVWIAYIFSVETKTKE